MTGDDAPIDDSAAGSPIRVDVLRRLAEQAMNDHEFREVARDDLDLALARWGYDLSGPERDLVHRFRASLADARVDLDLVAEFGDDQLRRLLDR
jgi:hypothetical protein